ncbi:hypothetical protein [Candidatus Hakubella thermalkaliphila]|uniref:Uncharacterized protein n=1 Tax=Candidatus Hakubella thermalkaliphila TaxID=2754717 RepID=A0A6V8P6R2_9ACTN|nr:hypothetical protein [Candidatus Hakubella thermalkaliphila]GFP28047.1 hypothetical protein HKBW3S33_01464 [Candidatus Hakubella thermalkaliphila]GFP43950.1 hypothetical protein HKBW3C_03079 [Candidatus Hakubella thermalkaliphila]
MKKSVIITLIGLFVIVGISTAFLLGKIKWGENKPPVNSGLNEEKPGVALILSQDNSRKGITGADTPGSKTYPDIMFSLPLGAKIFMPFESGTLDSGTAEVGGVKLELFVLKDENSSRELYFMAHDFTMGLPDVYKKGEVVGQVNSDKAVSLTYPDYNLVVFPDDKWYAKVAEHPRDPIEYLKLLFSLK